MDVELITMLMTVLVVLVGVVVVLLVEYAVVAGM